MGKIITMYAGDREIIRMTNNLLQMAVDNLDSVNDASLRQQDRDVVAECINEIHSVKDKLYKLDAHAVTYQLSPGQERP